MEEQRYSAASSVDVLAFELMSTESEREPGTEPEGGLPVASSGLRPAPHRRPAIPASRVEAQLRARIAELESKLAEVLRCLQDAEGRAAEVLVMKERVRSLEEERTVNDNLEDAHRRLAVIAGSRSWRITKPLRSVAQRARRMRPR